MENVVKLSELKQMCDRAGIESHFTGDKIPQLYIGIPSRHCLYAIQLADGVSFQKKVGYYPDGSTQYQRTTVKDRGTIKDLVQQISGLYGETPRAIIQNKSTPVAVSETPIAPVAPSSGLLGRKVTQVELAKAMGIKNPQDVNAKDLGYAIHISVPENRRRNEKLTNEYVAEKLEGMGLKFKLLPLNSVTRQSNGQWYAWPFAPTPRVSAPQIENKSKPKSRPKITDTDLSFAEVKKYLDILKETNEPLFQSLF